MEEWEWRVRRAARGVIKGFARRPQEYLGWEEWRYEVWRYVYELLSAPWKTPVPRADTSPYTILHMVEAGARRWPMPAV